MDSAAGEAAVAGLGKAEMVVTLSAFKANMEFSDVLLPIAPFTETSGTFVNAEGLAQSFHAVVRPAGEARPAWKVLRVLANLMKLPGFAFESSQEVLAYLQSGGYSLNKQKLSNACSAGVDFSAAAQEPCVASIYQLDGTVRRASSLQLTADAKNGVKASPSMEAAA
jgi:NADH-quinone oxidoreductase subunit G